MGLTADCMPMRSSPTDLRSLDLVTLCACETALGRSDPAGNIRGLPTALLAALRRRGSTQPPAGRCPCCTLFLVAFIPSSRSMTSRLLAFRAAQLAARECFPTLSDWGAFAYIGAWR